MFTLAGATLQEKVSSRGPTRSCSMNANTHPALLVAVVMLGLWNEPAEGFLQRD